jgi:hypothetical protein
MSSDLLRRHDHGETRGAPVRALPPELAQPGIVDPEVVGYFVKDGLIDAGTHLFETAGMFAYRAAIDRDLVRVHAPLPKVIPREGVALVKPE